MLNVDRPKSTLFWLQKSDGARILRAMAVGEIAISHNALDTLNPSRALDHLRDFLVAVNVLPPRDVQLERVVPWLKMFLADKPATQVSVLKPYATWYLLRRIRAKATQTPVTWSQITRVRAHLRRATDLLQWLEDRGKDLPHLRQADLDQWLHGSVQLHRAISPFLAWARERRLVGDVRPPRPADSEPADALADDLRWDLINQLLHSQQTSLDLRVAGLFVLLFGQHLTRIAHMTVDSVHCGQDAVEVTFGSSPFALPPPLDSLVRELLQHRGHSSFTSRQHHTWLFPGGTPGHPITAADLGLRLRKQAGIPTIRTARNATMLHLATEIPAPLLAELLGISTERAAAWADLAKRNWAAYVADRTRHPPQQGRNSEHIE